MFKQPRFMSLIRRRWFFAGLDTRHLNVYCLRTRFYLQIKTFFKINLLIEFTSQLSRLLKSMQLSNDNHFLTIFSDKNADLTKVFFIKSAKSVQKTFREWWAIPGSNQ